MLYPAELPARIGSAVGHGPALGTTVEFDGEPRSWCEYPSLAAAATAGGLGPVGEGVTARRSRW
jgi:hypothetical protein